MTPDTKIARRFGRIDQGQGSEVGKKYQTPQYRLDQRIGGIERFRQFDSGVDGDFGGFEAARHGAGRKSSRSFTLSAEAADRPRAILAMFRYRRLLAARSA